MKYLLCTSLIAATLSACTAQEDEVILSQGNCSKIGFYSSGGSQNYTDYAKYNVKAPELDNNPYFKQITSVLKDLLIDHIDNFENWVEIYRDAENINDLVKNYDFDKSLITESAFLYIYDNLDYPELAGFNVYFFDYETNRLYYFHNNI